MSEKLDAQRQQEYDFLHKEKCDRCGGPLTTRILSMFNMDVLCPECKRKETERPDYMEACEAERKALLAGNRNFEGIGLKDTVVSIQDLYAKSDSDTTNSGGGSN